MALKSLMAAAFIGGAAALAAVVLGFAGFELAYWHAAVLITTGVVSVVGRVALLAREPSRDWKWRFPAGCPRWLGWLTISLTSAGFALGLWMAFWDDKPPSLIAGAFGMFFFPEAFERSFSHFKQLSS